MKTDSTASRQDTSAGLKGLHPPLPTPMRDGEIDLASLEQMLGRLEPHVDGVLYGGSVSETASLALDERIAVLRRTVEVLGAQRVSFSIADNSIVNSQRLSEVGVELGVRLLVLSSPNYFTNDRQMLIEYFGRVADFTEGELCLYDNPDTTHTRLAVEDIVAIVEAVPRLTHIKVSDRAAGKVKAVREQTSLTVLSGEDSVLWQHMLSGAHGAMTALPLIFPAASRSLWTDYENGDFESAFDRYVEMARFGHAALEGPDYPSLIKAVMHHQGVLASPEARLPLIPADPMRLADAIRFV